MDAYARNGVQRGAAHDGTYPDEPRYPETMLASVLIRLTVPVALPGIRLTSCSISDLTYLCITCLRQVLERSHCASFWTRLRLSPMWYSTRARRLWAGWAACTLTPGRVNAYEKQTIALQVLPSPTCETKTGISKKLAPRGNH